MQTAAARQLRPFYCLAIFLFAFLTSCLTPAKMDAFVSKHYNDQMPKQDKKKVVDVVVNAAFPVDGNDLSNTVHKTDKFLPLLFYWKYDHRKTCSLNPAIAFTTFANTVNSLSSKSIKPKLGANQLELTVQQVPQAFAMVNKENMIWLVYAISWQKIYIEPDGKDLVVSYRLKQDSDSSKTGTITVKNSDKNKGIRFFQSWKSATSEYLDEYNANLVVMTREFVKKMQEAL